MGVEVISQSRSEERNPELIAMKGYKCHMSQRSRRNAIIPRNFSSEDVWDTGPSMRMESHAIAIVAETRFTGSETPKLGPSTVSRFAAALFSP